MKLLKKIIREILALVLIAELCVLPSAAIAADITVDTSVSNKPTLDTAQNGVTIVNLATVNDNGESQNYFTDYNVPKDGVILNNSLDNGRSSLGGVVYANPNYKENGIAATLVITEVTGSGRSNILGYTEMFGQKADYILVNPNGIVMNGSGFINMPMVTICTGSSIYNSSGDFTGFSVTGGGVYIEGNGVDATGTDYFSIITRTAMLSAPLWGNTVDITTGTGTYNYSDGSFSQQDTGTSSPEYSIDASVFGSIYAGRIILVSNEHGVGVRSAGTVNADVSDVTITADGNIVLNSAKAAGKIKIVSVSGKVTDTGEVTAKGDIDLSATGIVNSGTITSDSDITANGTLVNDGGTICASGSGTFSDAGAVSNSGGTIETGGGITIQGASSLDNTGGKILSNGDVSVKSAGTATNQDGVIYSSTDVEVTAGAIDNGNGRILSDGTAGLETTAGTLNNEEGTITTVSDLTVTGSLDNKNGDITLTGSSGTISIDAGTGFDNTGGNIQSGGSIELSTTGDYTVDEKTGNLYADKKLKLKAENITNTAGLNMNGSIEIEAEDSFTNSSGAKVVSGDTLTVKAGETVTNSGELSGKEISINCDSLTNSTDAVISGGGGTTGITVTGDATNSGRISSYGNLEITACSVTKYRREFRNFMRG